MCSFANVYLQHRGACVFALGLGFQSESCHFDSMIFSGYWQPGWQSRVHGRGYAGAGTQADGRHFRNPCIQGQAVGNRAGQPNAGPRMQALLSRPGAGASKSLCAGLLSAGPGNPETWADDDQAWVIIMASCEENTNFEVRFSFYGKL